MIVKMQKIGLVCLENDRAQALAALRDLGVLHLVHERPPENDQVEKVRAALEEARRAMDALPREAPAGAAETRARPDEIVREVTEILRQRKSLTDKIEESSAEYRRVEPFGDFDPQAIKRLAQQGVQVQLYRLPAGRPLPDVGHAGLEILRQDRSGSFFAVIARDPVDIGEQPVRLPEMSPAAMRDAMQEARSGLTALDARLTAHAGARPALSAHLAALEEELEYHAARAGMGTQGVLAYLRGFVPADQTSALREAARRHAWALLVEEPGEEDAVPTLLRNPAWVRPIKAIFDAIGILPGYREVDISPSFLLFLSLFFAMLIGDAGYGLLFLGLTWLARRKFPAAPGYPFRLLQIMSVCTVAWGVMNGIYFGAQPRAMSFLTVPWLAGGQGEHNIMLLCFIIGAVHLTVAHVWNFVRMWKAPQALAQLGWICTTWTMLFAARAMVLGADFPKIMFGVLALGIVLIVLFMTPRRQLKGEWFNHVMLPLNLVSNFVDVVSYLRLFAVGAASLAVAAAFNNMALELGAGVEPGLVKVLLGLAGVLIIFCGHTLNILLCAMGVLVHGVRLNTLEFSSHIGMQWSGAPYRPFARRAEQAPDGSGA